MRLCYTPAQFKIWQETIGSMIDIPDIPNIGLYAGVAFALIIVLFIILTLARSRGGGMRARHGQRLGVSEFRDIDNVRRLILVRRDGVEHLVLIGPNQD